MSAAMRAARISRNYGHLALRRRFSRWPGRASPDILGTSSDICQQVDLIRRRCPRRRGPRSRAAKLPHRERCRSLLRAQRRPRDEGASCHDVGMHDGRPAVRASCRPASSLSVREGLRRPLSRTRRQSSRDYDGREREFVWRLVLVGPALGDGNQATGDRRWAAPAIASSIARGATRRWSRRSGTRPSESPAPSTGVIPLATP